jgi:hypothetical protein
MESRLIRQTRAPDYLDMSEPEFNKIVRPYVTEIRKGRAVYFDRLDLDDWVEQFKAANGRPGKEKEQWQKEHQALERKAQSGTLKKSSPVSSFDKALENRSLNRQSGI